MTTTCTTGPATVSLPALAGKVPVVPRVSLRALFRAYRWRLLGTYGLFNLENVLRLAQPLVLGLAINDLLASRWLGLLLFAGQHLAFLLIGWARRAYDTRAFTRIYSDLATRLVLDQRVREVAVSRVAARSALSRAFVDFFERDVPLVVQAVYSVAGSLMMLCWYDWWLVPLCLGLLLPGYFLNKLYGRKTLQLSRQLHDELEREVEVIDRGKEREVRGHYDAVSRWRIKLSDWEALNFGVMELFVLALLATTLLRACRLDGAAAGDIFAMFRYVLMFVMAWDSVPMLVEQFSRIRDIHRRVHTSDSAAATEAGVPN
jgi:ABC-type multidrug transport system fused ATPase/permease subunit